MKVYNIRTKTYHEEEEEHSKLLDWMYNTISGRILLKTIFIKLWFNKVIGKYYDSKHSLRKVKKLTNNWQDYKSFNDYFSRKYQIENNSKPYELIAPAQSKLSVYKVWKDLRINTKNSAYTVRELINNDDLADKYSDGTCLIFRLSTTDYHRYIYMDDCTIEDIWDIPGVLHTVRPIQSDFKVYKQNHRVVTLINTCKLGKIITVEVGALAVGKIINECKVGCTYSRCEEKGHFEYGGSTIIVLIEKDRIKVREDITECMVHGAEAKVYIGDIIGQIV